MGWWTNKGWAHDEDELRTYYYIEAGPGGLSRLECYRRLLAHSDRRMPRALDASAPQTTGIAALGVGDATLRGQNHHPGH